MDEWLYNFKKWLRDQPKARLIVAALILLALLYILAGPRFGREYQLQIYNEILLAEKICENSRDWVLSNLRRLKLGQGDLRHIHVNGKAVDLEYVPYPKVMFMDSGIEKIGKGRTAQDVYCVYGDPRTAGDKRYYKYDERIWVEKVRFRR